MVGNDIKHDTRVYKSALALADGGLEVTVLGWSPKGYREDTRFGPVRIIRAPVSWRLRDQAAARRKARRERRVIPDPPTARDRRINTLRAGLRLAEVAEFGGGELAARAQAARARAILGNQWGRVLHRLAPKEAAWREAFTEWIGDQTAFASWRRDLPEIDDFELAYAPIIDAEEWEILHAHDVHHMGTAARAVLRRRAQGRPVKWVYDAHEYVAGLPIYPPRTKRFVAAYTDLEAEYIHRADAVITVTSPLADHLREQYSLPETPTVVMNSPQLQAQVRLTGPDVRAACGIAGDVPLVVYSGGVTPARGIQTVVEALPALPGVHLAVVCVPHNKTRNVHLLMQQAEELGVGDRVHMLDPVAPAQVSAFLATADVGIHPLVHFPGHEFALPNKLFEYLHAGLPLVVSDCRALAQFVRETQVGSVFTAEDASSCAAALREVLARREALHQRIASDSDLLAPYGWERQAATLRSLYRRLLGSPLEEPLIETALQDVTEIPAWRDDRPSVAGFGPSNMAGQGWEWAKAIETNIPGVTTRVIQLERESGLEFPADETVATATYRRDPTWGQRLEDEAIDGWTHVFLEAGRPLFGIRNGRDFEGDAKRLLARGLRVALIMHGSEIRNPARHATTTPWSPFRDPDDGLTVRLQEQFDVLSVKVRAFADNGVPVFVSTPDLQPDVPRSIWLPVVVDTDRWAVGEPVLERERPVVLHAPSRASLKGSARIDEILQELHDSGAIEYRRLENVPPTRMPDAFAQADVVLDQFSLGSYGVLACEAMAAGRVVLGHIVAEVRNIVSSAAGMPLPIHEATPDTASQVLLDLLADRATARAIADQGRRFVQEIHSGPYSAQVLQEHMLLIGK